MAEFLIELGAAKDVDFDFLLQVLEAKMFRTAELILYENNSLADSKYLRLSNIPTSLHPDIPTSRYPDIPPSVLSLVLSVVCPCYVPLVSLVVPLVWSWRLF
jgi:hypothetical protein